MNVGSITVSKTFVALVVSLLVFYFLYPALKSRSAVEQHDKLEQSIVQSINNHQAKLLASVDELMIVDSALRRCIDHLVAERGKIPLTSSGAIHHARDLKLATCAGRGIEHLDGIEHMQSLTFLDVSNNKLRDITMLQNHSSLEVVYLQANPLDDIEVLASLPALKQLRLPRLRELDCHYLDSLLRGVKYSKANTGCRPETQNNNHLPTWEDDTKPLSDRQQQELFDYEQRY